MVGFFYLSNMKYTLSHYRIKNKMALRETSTVKAYLKFYGSRGYWKWQFLGRHTQAGLYVYS